MKAVLLKDARINHKAGETVEVSPTVFEFLASIGVAVKAEPAQEEQTKPKRTTKKKEV